MVFIHFRKDAMITDQTVWLQFFLIFIYLFAIVALQLHRDIEIFCECNHWSRGDLRALWQSFHVKIIKESVFKAKLCDFNTKKDHSHRNIQYYNTALILLILFAIKIVRLIYHTSMLQHVSITITDCV